MSDSMMFHLLNDGSSESTPSLKRTFSGTFGDGNVSVNGVKKAVDANVSESTTKGSESQASSVNTGLVSTLLPSLGVTYERLVSFSPLSPVGLPQPSPSPAK